MPILDPHGKLKKKPRPVKETVAERTAGIAQVEKNKADAAKMGITIPGSSGTYDPNKTDMGSLYSTNNNSGGGGGGTGSDQERQARSVLYDLEPFDEGKRRDELIRQNRKRIASLDAVYDDRVRQEQAYGQKDLARSNTISAMTGMMGAPEATSRAGAADRRTNERIEQVNNIRMAAIQEIYAGIDENVRREKEAHLSTTRENAARTLAEVANNAYGALNSFAAQGMPWEALERSDPETLQNLIRQTGKNPFELRLLYEDSLPQELKPQTVFEGFRGDNFVRIVQNPDGTLSNVTMSAAELGIPKDVDVSTVTFGGGVYWYDKNNPVDANGMPNLTRLGSSGSGEGGSGNQYYTASTVPQDVRSDIIADITENSATLAQLYAAYPEVSNDYINTVYQSIKKDTPEKAEDTKLTRQNLASLYGIADDDSKTGGFMGFGGTAGKDQLDALEGFVNSYRAVGFDDKEILKLIQDQQED